MPPGHWATNAINYVIDQSYMQGYQDGEFNPDNNITRAEVAVVLSNALKLTPGGNHSFADITAGYSWAEPYIAALYNRDTITGTSSNTYEPGRNLTRE